jgi:hypothetical protein
MLDSLFKGKKIPKIVIFAGAGILTILIIITSILVLVDKKPGPRTTEITTYTDNSRVSPGLRVMDLYLDNELQFFLKREAYPMRDPSSVWDKQEVDRYFIPVDEILYEYFQKKNDNYIKEIFSNIE